MTDLITASQPFLDREATGSERHLAMLDYRRSRYHMRGQVRGGIGRCDGSPGRRAGAGKEENMHMRLWLMSALALLFFLLVPQAPDQFGGPQTTALARASTTSAVTRGVSRSRPWARADRGPVRRGPTRCKTCPPGSPVPAVSAGDALPLRHYAAAVVALPHISPAPAISAASAVPSSVPIHVPPPRVRQAVLRVFLL